MDVVWYIVCMFIKVVMKLHVETTRMNFTITSSLCLIFYYFLLHFQQTVSHDSHVTMSHDKGQYPIATAPEKKSKSSSTAFRDFLDLSRTQDSGGLFLDTSFKVNDTSYAGQDSEFSWPSGHLDESKRSFSPNMDAGAINKDPSNCPVFNRTRAGRASSSDLRHESPSPTLPKGTRFRSSYTRRRDRSRSPSRDGTLSPPAHRGRRRGHTLNKDFDSCSLPELPISSAPLPRSATETASIVTTASFSTVTNVSALTDTSTITSTTTSPPTTQSDLSIHALGLSPPVRDSGSSLTTVTTLTDQNAHDCIPDQRRYSFDLGFLDILTIDSNSSVADQLSTGRVSGLQNISLIVVVSGHFQKVKVES